MENNEKQRLITPKGRVSFPHLFEPDAIDEQSKPKYSVGLLIPKDNAAGLAPVLAAIEAAVEAGKTSKWGGKTPAKLKLPLQNGDEIYEANPDRAECQGHYLLKASSTMRPGVVDKNRQAIDAPGDVYAGCYGRASVFFAPYDTAGSKGVTCILKHFQKLAEGEPLGSTSTAADDFNDGVGEAEPDNKAFNPLDELLG